MKNKFKHIYGPVSSWRLGSSLGVDLISGVDKACTFDCIYCQVGRAKALGAKRKVFTPTKDIIKEIRSLPKVKIDYITFSGNGEPTLAENLGEVITAIRKIRNEKIAILTNSSLIHKKDVQRDLLRCDFVIAKLDASSDKILSDVNHPTPRLRVSKIIKGLKDFNKRYRGKLALQIMFVRANKKYVAKIAKIVREIDPDEVQINTPLRPCGIKPLSKNEIRSIKVAFEGMNTVSTYDTKKRKTKPINEKGVFIRRGKR
ncbi:radical SAM protein [Candidatus Omnitrophota bacterium]